MIGLARASLRCALLLGAAAMVPALAQTVGGAPAAEAKSQSAQTVPAVPAGLVGTWVITSFERQMVPLADMLGETFTIAADGTFRVSRGERQSWVGKLRVDSRKKTVDFLHEGTGLMPPKRGDVWEGIYRMVGEELEINTAGGHDGRPSEFLGGYDLTLLRMQRRAQDGGGEK